MKAVTTMSRAAVILGLAATVLANPFSETQPHGDALSAESTVAALGRIRDSLTKRPALHFVASAELALDHNGVTTRGTGKYEYWEHNGRYKIDSRADRGFGLAPHVIVSYDGTRFSYFDGEQGILSRSRADTRNNPAALPNPLFLPFQFAFAAGGDCRTCKVRLSDLAYPITWNTLMQVATNQDGVGIVAPSSSERSVERVGRLSYHGSAPSGRDVRLERLEVFDRYGANRATASFQSFDADGVARSMTIVAAGDGGHFGRMTAVFTIDALEQSDSLAESVFNIDPEVAKIEWDSDSMVWLKLPKFDGPLALEALSPEAAAAMRRMVAEQPR